MSVSGPEHAIYLLPLENAKPEQLRRWLGREAWRKNPVAWLCYEPDGDRIMVRLLDAPSRAMGVFDAERCPDPDDDLFIGFDGADAVAWPTTIALLGVSRHCDRDSRQLSFLCELVGSDVWEAALSLRGTAAGEREITISQDEAVKLIGRWSDRVVSLDGPGPSDETLDAVMAEWSAAVMTQKTAVMTRKQYGSATHRPRPPDSLSYSFGTSIAMAGMKASVISRSRVPRRSSSGYGRAAGRRLEGPEATGAGATMTRTSLPALDSKPLKPLRYGPWARLSDIWAAWRDGHAEVPPLSRAGDSLDPADARLGVTPYMEIRNRHFLDRAERERRRMLIELDGTYRVRAEIQQKIVGAEERAAEARKLLDSMPSEPPDLDRRNVLEQHVHEALIHARRFREFQAERLKVLMLEQDATKEAAEFRAEEAELAETIAARERVLDSRVRQLYHHSMRRCGTYIRHIVHHHPDGSAVIPYLEMTRPTLPDWLPATRSGGARADGPGGS